MFQLRFTGKTVALPALPSLPRALQSSTRSGEGGEADPLLANLVSVQAELALSPPERGEAEHQQDIPDDALLALEAEDGTTVFIRADRLREDVARNSPDAIGADGALDLTRFRDSYAMQRGAASWLWRKLQVLDIRPDDLVASALKEAKRLALEKLGDKLEEKAYEIGSYFGTKALMSAIEARLAGVDGLYAWAGKKPGPEDLRPAGDARLEAAAKQGRMLVLIHGTASTTVGSFEGLSMDGNTWNALTTRFPGGVYGFEHRTFSKSPIENAVELVAALPAGAQVSLLTHSRGGLVGDLACIGDLSDGAIARYGRKALAPKDETRPDLPEQLEHAYAEEREQLTRLRAVLRSKQLRLDRYSRVACPARGTRLLSDNLDVFLSGLLGLIQKSGAALASALASPAAGTATSSVLGVLKRALLEIAKNRLNPRLVPGIAAMSVDSPLAAFLGHPETARAAVEMGVVAGDIEVDAVRLHTMLPLIKSLFADWLLFDGVANDLVVDTDSMFAGLGFRADTRYVFTRDDSVDHFHYFKNPPSRDAVRRWLTEDKVAALNEFVERKSDVPLKVLASRGGRGDRPVVVLLPGTMGSHLQLRKKRVWFDLSELGTGGLARIRNGTDGVAADEVFAQYYGELVQFLSQSYEVVPFAYDWRGNIAGARGSAASLGQVLKEVLANNPKQPVILLAHSMGGLVARALIADQPALWDRIVQGGGRLVMLGTPNNGSHALVHSLLGKTKVMRSLALLDQQNDLQEIVDIVGGFVGALSLMPRPGWAGEQGDLRLSPGQRELGAAEFYQLARWQELKAANHDRWFSDGAGATPENALLQGASEFWTKLGAAAPAHAERISYVFGKAKETPSGVCLGTDPRNQRPRLELAFSSEGDGSVTWSSGKLPGLSESQYWLMPVEHADLTGESQYFPMIAELCATGRTERLERLPRARGAAPARFMREAGPPVFPSEDELARALLGSSPKLRSSSVGVATLALEVRAGDVRHVQAPILVGHYRGDAIAGAEAALDRHFAGRLSERHRLNLYADELGTSAIVLMPPGAAGDAQLGAIVVGLGDLNGQLSVYAITETVRAACLRLLMMVRDTMPPGAPRDGEKRKLELASVLIGYNSAPSISIAESMAAVTLAVVEANHKFRGAVGAGNGDTLAITKLTFVELYIDAAISAAHALLELPERLAADLKRKRTILQLANQLRTGEGVRQRLGVGRGFGYWPRLIVTDADRDDDGACPPECFETRMVSRIPPGVRAMLCKHDGPCDCANAGNVPPPPAPPPGSPPDAAASASPVPAAPPSAPAQARQARYFPARLKYLFLSARARAEAMEQQGQPGLVDMLVERQLASTAFDEQLARLLFQLMVPVELKAVMREQPTLALVVDSYTANLPWEMLQIDDEPMIMRTSLVRQLSTHQYRKVLRTSARNTACVIGNPKVTGYETEFGGNPLPSLEGAEREATAIRAVLDAHWTDPPALFVQPGADATAVLSALYDRPYRVLVISGHGVFEQRARDGSLRSGVVLSDGLLLTAAEVGQMEVVPELVFLNCCHLGRTSGSADEGRARVLTNGAPNKLAHSLARELINMGVRCVIAAGWAVDDEAARTFATTFFEQLVTKASTFGDALFEARRTTFRAHRQTNTWGAYQAYGDPSFRLREPDDAQDTPDRRMSSIEELIDAIIDLRGDLSDPAALRKATRRTPEELEQQVDRMLMNVPAEWTRDAEVQLRLAELYAALGPVGFERARAYYLRAVHSADPRMRVAIDAMSELANLEARHGYRLGLDALRTLAALGSSEPAPKSKSKPSRKKSASAAGPAPELDARAKQLAEANAQLEKGRQLISTAIERMTGLTGVFKSGLLPSMEQVERNLMPWSTLASARKRLAALEAALETTAAKPDWQKISAILSQSRAAYAFEGTDIRAGKPYHVINRLQLDWLLEKRAQRNWEPSLQELGRAAAEAEKAFVSSLDFFDAVFAPDAMVTRWLMGDLKAADVDERIAERYRAVAESVSADGKKFDSVIEQLRMLAAFLRVRRARGDAALATTLDAIVTRLEANS